MSNSSTDRAFTVEFTKGEVEFGPASHEIWDTFLDHLKRRDRAGGELMLVQKCCTSLSVNEATGAHQLLAYLDDEPASISCIADEIESISGGHFEAEPDGREVTCSGFRFGSPNRMQWDSFQLDLADENYRGGAASRKLLGAIVDDEQGFVAWLKANPAALASVIMPVTKLAGRGIKITRKKA